MKVRSSLHVPIMIITAIVVFVAGVPSPHAEILAADLRVNGMSCPFCAFGIEKKLQAVEGVEEVEVLLDEGIARITLSRGNAVSIGALEKAVSDAGFELAALQRLRILGALEPGTEYPTLDAGAGLRFRLLERLDGELKVTSAKTMKEIEEEGVNGKIVIEGPAHRHDGSELPALVVERHGAPPEPAS